jgi:hypothetical protein
VAVTGVKAVVVRQKESGARLSVAEIKIFVGDEEVSSSADCFSLIAPGWGNMDPATGAQWRLNDGDLDTYSLSGDWNAEVQNYGTHACTHTHSRRACKHPPTHTDRHTDKTHRQTRTHTRTHTHTYTHKYARAHSLRLKEAHLFLC